LSDEPGNSTAGGSHSSGTAPQAPPTSFRGSKLLAILTSGAALGFSAVLLVHELPHEEDFASQFADVVGKFETEDHLTPISALDAAIVAIFIALVIGGLALTFVARLFAAFFVAVLKVCAGEPVRDIVIDAAPPSLTWLVFPIGAFAGSVATVRVFSGH
jgi:hypothetical protein